MGGLSPYDAPMADLQTLTEKIIRFRDERDWAQFHNPKDLALSLSLEAAELLEIFQWKDGAAIAATAQEKKAELAHELADVLYWTLLMAHDLKIDLGAALEEKLVANAKKYPVDKAKGSSAKYTEL
jgi:NTP pyrophosphatase (non-canonical NTP hydrolase)